MLTRHHSLATRCSPLQRSTNDLQMIKEILYEANTPYVFDGTVSSIRTLPREQVLALFEPYKLKKEQIIACRYLERFLLEEKTGIEYMLMALINTRYATSPGLLPQRLVMRLNELALEYSAKLSIPVEDINNAIPIFVQVSIRSHYTMFPTMQLRTPPVSSGASLLEVYYNAASNVQFIDPLTYARLTIDCLQAEFIIPRANIAASIVAINRSVVITYSIFGPLYRHYTALKRVRKMNSCVGSTMTDEEIDTLTANATCIGTSDSSFDDDLPEIPHDLSNFRNGQRPALYLFTENSSELMGSSQLETTHMIVGYN